MLSSARVIQERMATPFAMLATLQAPPERHAAAHFVSVMLEHRRATPKEGFPGESPSTRPSGRRALTVESWSP